MSDVTASHQNNLDFNHDALLLEWSKSKQLETYLTMNIREKIVFAKQLLQSKGGEFLLRCSEYLLANGKPIFHRVKMADDIATQMSENPSGAASFTVGLPFFRQHFWSIRATDKVSMETYQELLRMLMALDGPLARVGFTYALHALRAHAFVGETGAQALEERHDFIRHFQLAQFKAFAAEQIEAHFCSRMSPPSHDEIGIVVANLFTRYFLSVDIKDNRTLRELITNNHPTWLEFGVFMPERLLPIFAQYRDYCQREGDRLTQFFVNSLKQIRGDAEKNNLQPSYFLEKVTQVSGVDDYAQLTDQQIETLANDPVIRGMIAVMLVPENLSFVVSRGCNELTTNNDWRNQFVEAAARCEDLNETPFGYAFYLECLRSARPNAIVMRYTEQQLNWNGITIPAKSMVKLELDGMIKACAPMAGVPDYQFEPKRFLDDAGQLNQYARLHNNGFVPFSLGYRQCPGMALAKFVFHHFMLEHAKSLQRQEIRSMQLSGPC